MSTDDSTFFFLILVSLYHNRQTKSFFIEFFNKRRCTSHYVPTKILPYFMRGKYHWKVDHLFCWFGFNKRSKSVFNLNVNKGTDSKQAIQWWFSLQNTEYQYSLLSWCFIFQLKYSRLFNHDNVTAQRFYVVALYRTIS